MGSEQGSIKSDQTCETKHGVSFRVAAQGFRDPGMMSLFDEENSLDEDRWITLGVVGTGQMLLVVHTFDEISPEQVVIRIISARKANRSEIQQYQGEEQCKKTMTLPMLCEENFIVLR